VVTLDDWLKKGSDKPPASSPVVAAMRELLKLCPNLNYNECRVRINRIGASTCSPAECAARASQLPPALFNPAKKR
jgi:hypothetical protein